MTNILLPALSFIISLSAYFLTLRPCLGWSGDSAKFQFLGKVLGIAGPTGYPGYMLVSHLFSLLPFSSLAFRNNLISAISGSLTVLVLYFIIKRITNNNLVSFLASMVMALSLTFWAQCIITEVYTLNSLFLLTVVLNLLKWNDEKDIRFLWLAGFFYFMGFGIHLMMILFLPAILVFIIISDYKTLFYRQTIVLFLVFMLLGMLQYSYLFLRSIHSKPYFEYDVFNMQEFIWRMTGGEFREKMFSSLTAGSVLEKATRYVALLRNQFLMPGIALGIAGMSVMLRDKLKTGLFLALIFISDVVYSAGYNIPDIEVYFVPSYLIFSVFIGYGLNEIFKIDFKKISKNIWQPFLAVLFIVITVAAGYRNFIYLDSHRDVIVDRFTNAVLERVEENSIILAPDYDWLKFYLYKLVGEKKKKKESVYLLWNWCPEDIMTAYLCYPFSNIPEEVRRIPSAVSKYRLRIFNLMGYPSIPPAGKKWNIYFQDNSGKIMDKAGLKSMPVLSMLCRGENKKLFKIISDRDNKALYEKPVTVMEYKNSIEELPLLKKLLYNLTGTVKITCGMGDKGFFIGGWSYPEINAESIPFCWAVEDKASLFLPLAGKSRQVRISIKIKSFYPGTKIKVFVNNDFLSEIEPANEWEIYNLGSEHKYWRKGANVIEFRTYQFQRTTVNVSELRDLYFALEYIRI